MENKIYLGNITGTHGIKGELKILSDFERKDLVFKKNFKIFINGEELVITSHRPHKNFNLVTVNNLLDINLVYKYVKSDVYILREDLNFKGNEYLTSDLVGFDVYDGEEHIGKIKKIMYNKFQKLLCCALDKKIYYIPFVDVYIKEVKISDKKVITENGKDLIL